MAARTINILGLCSGLGWLEFAACETFGRRGIEAQCICHCERDAVTAALLASLQAQAGSEAPIWDDIATFDGRPWRGVVDCMVAGLPCPAYSVAGKRRGNDDERAWGGDDNGPQRHFLRIAGEILPEYLLLENVPQYVAGGHFRRLGEGLLGLGYRIPPAVFLSAGDVGATQGRERVFVLAVRQDAQRRRELQPRESAADGRSGPTGVGAELGLMPRGGQRADRRASRDAGHAEQSGGHVGGPVGVMRREKITRRGPDRRTASGRTGAGMGGGTRKRRKGERLSEPNERDDYRVFAGAGEIMGRTRRARHEVAERSGACGDARAYARRPVAESSRELGNAQGLDLQRDSMPGAYGQRFEDRRPGGDLGLFPPGRGHWTDPEWQRVIELDPARVPAIEPGFSMVVDGLAVAGSDLLRIGGNGVVPLAAAVALDFLLDSIDDPKI